MTQSINQPPFWLSVRKEYVVDNFDSLIDYLRNYQYIAENEAPDGDFNRTYKCLGEVADDYLAKMADDNLVRAIQRIWNESQGTSLKILVAYLLTTKEKKGTDDFRLLGRLADLLLLWEWNRDVDLDKVRDIIFSSLMQRPVKSLGFKWNDLKEGNDVFIVNFPYRLCQTTFAAAEAAELPAYYEGSGLVVLQSDKLKLAPMRFSDYLLNRSSLYTLLPITSPVNICQTDKIRQTTFTLLQDSCADIQHSFAGISPATSAKGEATGPLKDYQKGDPLVVRITSISFVPIAESVDPAYNPVKGKIFLNSYYHGLSKDRLLSLLNVGDCLLVTMQANGTYPFKLDDTFEDFFDYYCNGAVGYDYKALYIEPFPLGHRWLTEEGLTVNILGQPTAEAAEAIKAKGIITIHIDDYKQDRSKKWILSGSYIEGAYMQLDEHGDFKLNARKTLVQAFIDDTPSEPDKPEKQPAGIPISPQGVRQLSHIVYRLTQRTGFPESADRYRNLFIAYLLAEMAQSPVDAAFIKHQLDYLACLVQFAEDREGNLGLVYDDLLNGCDEVSLHHDILQALNSYRNPIIPPAGSSQIYTRGSVDNIKQLVFASNSLRGIIPPSELNRIKKTIAGNLGVADVYQNLFNDHTYYGEESDTLEFKTSIVYPPGTNKPDPDRQRWNILKPICGFLNTITGGELLLGVNDNGNSTGLQNDIDYLSKAGKINEKSADKYRLYVKHQVDNAFTDDTGLASLAEITTTRIKYIIEPNTDGDTILRIQVSPYEYGIVKFKDTAHLPEDFSDCYYRSSGSTVPMTDELRRQAREKKLSITVDDDIRRLLDLQRSLSERRIVILKDYSSKTGIKDRRVEVSQLLPDRKAVICYDLDKHDLREYKVTRFKEVVFTNQTWKHDKEHHLLSVDLFGMVEKPNQKPFRVVLKLRRLAYNLLLEENASAERHVSPNTDADTADYPFVLDTIINEVMGVGRFYLGLSHEIQIQEGQPLIDYARDYMLSTLKALPS